MKKQPPCGRTTEALFMDASRVGTLNIYGNVNVHSESNALKIYEDQHSGARQKTLANHLHNKQKDQSSNFRKDPGIANEEEQYRFLNDIWMHVEDAQIISIFFKDQDSLEKMRQHMEADHKRIILLPEEIFAHVGSTLQVKFQSISPPEFVIKSSGNDKLKITGAAVRRRWHKMYFDPDPHPDCLEHPEPYQVSYKTEVFNHENQLMEGGFETQLKFRWPLTPRHQVKEGNEESASWASPAIGIDLGTTYSCVATMQTQRCEKPRVVQNGAGNFITPSCVAFAERDSLIGEAARHRMIKNPKNTIFGIKRIIGRPFSDPVVQEQKKKWDFDIVNRDGKTKIKVIENGEVRTLYPEEISAMVLAHMKEIVEDYIGERVFGAVITVPANFNIAQRSATKDAAAMAGIHVLGIINEPTAAAIAYGFQRKFSSKQNVLVFHLGGGTFDVTLMSTEDGVFDVKAVAGDTHLGGEDFTENLYAHLVAEFKRVHHKDLTASPRARYRLKTECEKIKKLLSATYRTKESVFIDALFDGIDLDCQVTRETFEGLNKGLFDRTIQLVDQVLREANMKEAEVHNVILVGGSTRLSFIREALQRQFGEGKILQTINPGEAVAYGAAVHANFLLGDVDAELLFSMGVGLLAQDCFEKSKIKEQLITIKEFTPLSLAIRVGNDRMSEIIPRHTEIPAKAYRTFTINTLDQTSMTIEIYEGEKCTDYTEMNHLCNFFLKLPSTSAEALQIQICFELDIDGILQVSATDMERGSSIASELENIRQAEGSQKQDASWKETNKALNTLEAHVKDIRTRVEKWRRDPGSRAAKNRDVMLVKCQQMSEWIAQNQSAPVDEVVNKRREIDALLSQLT